MVSKKIEWIVKPQKFPVTTIYVPPKHRGNLKFKAFRVTVTKLQ